MSPAACRPRLLSQHACLREQKSPSPTKSNFQKRQQKRTCPQSWGVRQGVKAWTRVKQRLVAADKSVHAQVLASARVRKHAAYGFTYHAPCTHSQVRTDMLCFVDRHKMACSRPTCASPFHPRAQTRRQTVGRNYIRFYRPGSRGVGHSKSGCATEMEATGSWANRAGLCR